MDFKEMMAAALPYAKVEALEVEGLGTVKVRGLTRSESLIVGKSEGDPTSTERTMLRYGLVEPALTEAQIKEWLAVAPNDHVDPITKAIARLSGMIKSSEKDAYKSAGDGTGD
jgi:hypothetical protein